MGVTIRFVFLCALYVLRGDSPFFFKQIVWNSFDVCRIWQRQEKTCPQDSRCISVISWKRSRLRCIHLHLGVANCISRIMVLHDWQIYPEPSWVVVRGDNLGKCVSNGAWRKVEEVEKFGICFKILQLKQVGISCWYLVEFIWETRYYLRHPV